MIPLMKNAFLNQHATKLALADFILKAEIFSMGKECASFEHKFSVFQKRKNAVLVNSGGSANLALLQALKNLGKLKSGDCVGFSALTWSTNVMPIIQMGFIPVPVDCSVKNMNVGSEQLLKTLEIYNLKALFLTNVLGFVSDIENLRDICNEKGIILLEDNCESLGTVTTQGNMTGNFGLASTFSFFVAHHMSTIEGGMICTDDEELSEMLKIVRANGWDRNLNAVQQEKWRKKYNIESEFQAKYSFYDLGFNFRPTEITGFLGSYQLDFLEENILTREKNYKLLN
jgi:CDP-6-deoxy-D-xylo-4-hexulose-3-dehydrase